MITAAALTITATMLFYIVRYRVHIHVTYTKPAGRARHHRTPKPASGSAIARTSEPARSTAARSSDASSLVSALVNLGAKPGNARAAAERAIKANPAAPFETLLRKAIQEAA